MIEVKFEDRKIVNDLYDQIKNIVLSKNNNKTYLYNRHQHCLYEESQHPGISKNYYNEDGEITYLNSNNQTITIRFSRIHPHKHNGYSGLNGIPILNATINVDDKVVWKLIVESGTLHYKAIVTSLELPLELLKEKEIEVEEPKTTKKEVTEKKHKPTINIGNIEDEINKGKNAKEELLDRINQEINNARNEILNKYAKELQQIEESINNSKNKINEFDDMVSKDTTFDTELIIRAIEKLITFMENEDYVFKQVKCKTTIRVHGPIDSWDEEKIKTLYIIVTKNNMQSIYTEEELNRLINLGKCLIIKDDEKDITFYTSENGNIKSTIDFSKFEYVKKFINILIRYRYHNDNLSIDDINRILREFLLDNKSIIIHKIDDEVSRKILQLI